MHRAADFLWNTLNELDELQAALYGIEPSCLLLNSQD